MSGESRHPFAAWKRARRQVLSRSGTVLARQSAWSPKRDHPLATGGHTWPILSCDYVELREQSGTTPASTSQHSSYAAMHWRVRSATRGIAPFARCCIDRISRRYPRPPRRFGPASPARDVGLTDNIRSSHKMTAANATHLSLKPGRLCSGPKAIRQRPRRCGPVRVDDGAFHQRRGTATGSPLCSAGGIRPTTWAPMEEAGEAASAVAPS